MVGLILANAIASFYKSDSDMESELLKTVGYFMALALGLFVANIFGKGLWSVAGEALSARLRVMTFNHLLKMEMGFFDERGHSAGSLETRLSADAGLVKGATGESLSQVVSSAGGLIVSVIISIQASWRIGLRPLVKRSKASPTVCPCVLASQLLRDVGTGMTMLFGGFGLCGTCALCRDLFQLSLTRVQAFQATIAKLLVRNKYCKKVYNYERNRCRC